MTNYLSTGRNQKPRVLRVKQALQFTLILAICIWLLYQIKPSNEGKNYGLSKWSKLSKEGKTSILGRKGSASSDRNDSLSEDAHFLIENDATDDSDTENWTTELVLDREKALMKNDTDEISAETESGSTLQHNETVNETISEHSEMEDGKHSFPDENGIPEELQKDYQNKNFDHLTISSKNVQSKMSKSKVISRQKSMQKNVAEDKDDGTTADLENVIKVDSDSSNLKIMQVRSKDSNNSQLKCCVFETDSRVLVLACNGQGEESYFHTITSDCVQLLKHFDRVLVEFVYRSANRVAHELAKAAHSMSGRVDSSGDKVAVNSVKEV